jgi:hypothetical protein
MITVDEAMNKHKEAVESWTHGEPVESWVDNTAESPVLCIRYADGAWWHYNDNGEWW